MANVSGFNVNGYNVYVNTCPTLLIIFNTTNLTFASLNANLKNCLDGEVANIKYYLFAFIQPQIEFVCCFLGFLGSILTLITLANKNKFDSVTFIYFRLLAVLQIGIMLAYFNSAFRRLLKHLDYKYYVWFFTTVYLEPMFQYGCVDGADLIICYLSIERAVALIKPTRFHLLNRKGVFYSVSSMTFLISIIYPVVSACEVEIIFNKTGTGIYEDANGPGTPTYDKMQKFRTALGYVKPITLIICTVLILVGLYTAGRRRKKVHQNGNAWVGSGNADLPLAEMKKRKQKHQDEWKTNMQISLLQLAQALPTTINNAVLFYTTFPDWTVSLIKNNFDQLTDDQLKSYFSAWYNYYVITDILLGLKNLAHSSHFFFFLWFSRTFREGFISAMKSCLKIG